VSKLSFDAGAAAYERFMGRWSRLYIPGLLTGAGLRPGNRVLDVATGTGAAAELAAAAVRPAGRVIGVDLSLPMLQAAHGRLTGPIALAVMDGQALACRDESADVVLCQLGLMFFPDLGRGLAEFHRVLRPGGRLAACVWSTPERAPFVGFLAQALTRQLPDQRATLELGFSLADPRRLEAALDAAGFRAIRVVAETRRIVLDSFDDYWAPVEAGAGRLGQAYRGLPAPAQQSVMDDVRQRMATVTAADGRIRLDAEALFAFAAR
jgi:ubiquinone/menaquinone biosynthesis C-methylase UbiE